MEKMKYVKVGDYNSIIFPMILEHWSLNILNPPLLAFAIYQIVK